MTSMVKCQNINDAKINLPGLFDKFLVDIMTEPKSAPIAVYELNKAKSEAFPFKISLIIKGK